jgi:hypothetical protein
VNILASLLPILLPLSLTCGGHFKAAAQAKAKTETEAKLSPAEKAAAEKAARDAKV